MTLLLISQVPHYETSKASTIINVSIKLKQYANWGISSFIKYPRLIKNVRHQRLLLFPKGFHIPHSVKTQTVFLLGLVTTHIISFFFQSWPTSCTISLAHNMPENLGNENSRECHQRSKQHSAKQANCISSIKWQSCFTSVELGAYWVFD